MNIQDAKGMTKAYQVKQVLMAIERIIDMKMSGRTYQSHWQQAPGVM